MKFKPLLLLTGCWLLSVAHSAGLDRDAFTFTNYDLNVRVEPEQQRLAVRGKVTLHNDSPVAQRNAVLQISSSLEWRSIQVNGRQVQFVAQVYTSDIDHTGALSEAIITLPQEIKPGGEVQLSIGYEGVVPLDTTRLTRIGTPEEVAKHTDWDQITAKFSAVRGVGYVTWYPVATQAANLSEGKGVFDILGRWKARAAASHMHVSIFDVGLDSGSRPTVVANGECVAMDTKEGTAEFKSTDCSYAPLGWRVPGFVVGLYELVEGSALRVWALPQHRTAADSYVADANRVVPLVKEWFGSSRAKAEVIDLPDAQASPSESGSVLFTPLSDHAKLAEISLIHELTHAAFLSPRAWIFEGAAHFAQALYREQLSGRPEALSYMDSHRAALVEAENAVDKTNLSADRSLVNTSDEELYRSKAMFVFWMLRDMIGSVELKRALAAYKPSDDLEPSYLQRLISGQTKRDLEWFFDDWVYRDRGLADFRVESAYPRKTVLGGYVITVTVENRGSAGAEVPVTVKVEGGVVTKRLEVRAKAKASIRIEVPGKPLEVVVNDGSVPDSDLANNSSKVDVNAAPQ